MSALERVMPRNMRGESATFSFLATLSFIETLSRLVLLRIWPLTRVLSFLSLCWVHYNFVAISKHCLSLKPSDCILNCSNLIVCHFVICPVPQTSELSNQRNSPTPLVRRHSWLRTSLRRTSPNTDTLVPPKRWGSFR